QAGLLREGGPELMAEHFFGLLWGDLRLGLLLRVAPPPRRAEIEHRARDAALTFLPAYWALAQLPGAAAQLSGPVARATTLARGATGYSTHGSAQCARRRPHWCGLCAQNG